MADIIVKYFDTKDSISIWAIQNNSDGLHRHTVHPVCTFNELQFQFI